MCAQQHMCYLQQWIYLFFIFPIKDSVSQFCEPLVELLAVPFNASDDHIVIHPSGHWVIKRLITSEEQRGGEESSFAVRILSRVSADDIQSWATTNRGAFVICRLDIITNDHTHECTTQ